MAVVTNGRGSVRLYKIGARVVEHFWSSIFHRNNRFYPLLKTVERSRVEYIRNYADRVCVGHRVVRVDGLIDETEQFILDSGVSIA